MFVTKRNMVKATERVIAEVYDKLKEELEVPDIKITVKDGYCKDGKRIGGRLVVCRRTDIFDVHSEYLVDKSYILIYPLVTIQTHAFRIMRYRHFKEHIIDTIAHEMRHHWQNMYNKCNVHNRIHIRVEKILGILPESERDAYEYGHDFTTRYMKTAK
jgi:hypothetical protein